MRPSRVLLLVLALVLGWAWPAAAHTALVSTDPASGASLDAAPEQIVLTFTEALRQPSSASVLVDGDAREAKATVAGARLLVTPAEPVAGRYEINYRVVSADGHPITGTTSFTVAAAPANPTESPLERPSTAAPSDVASEPTASASPSAESAETDEQDGVSPVLWIVLGVVVVVALAAFALVRARSGASDDRH